MTLGVTRGLTIFALINKTTNYRTKKLYSLYIFPPELHTLMTSLSNFFNPSKKNSFGCAANRKSQRLTSNLAYGCLRRLCLNVIKLTSENRAYSPPLTDYKRSDSLSPWLLLNCHCFTMDFLIFFIFKEINTQTVKIMKPAGL
jgi:hypothetical protein